MAKITLKDIIEKYQNLEFNTNNYEIGGGLATYGMSNRHYDAKNDPGKLTLGEFVKLVKKATGLESCYIKTLILFHFERLEWHHAGRFGGKMNRCYFVNSEQIVEFCTNLNEIIERYENRPEAIIERLHNEAMAIIEAAPKTIVERSLELPSRCIFLVKKEMKGEHGWFEASSKYKLDTYYTYYNFDPQDYAEMKVKIRALFKESGLALNDLRYWLWELVCLK